MDTLKIFQMLSTEFKENFDKYKTTGYTLAEYCAIPFFTKEIGYREVNNWGTEEGTDIHLLFFPEGWKLGKMTVQTGAGINKIVENNIQSISEEELVTWFQQQADADQREMLTKAKSIIQRKIEFKI